MNRANETIVAVLHECATNDTNGNPRRVWVGITKSGHVGRIEDEGYGGRPEWVRQLAIDCTWDVHIEVTPAQYRHRLHQLHAMQAAESLSNRATFEVVLDEV
jgi:hypothetical protein